MLARAGLLEEPTSALRPEGDGGDGDSRRQRVPLGEGRRDAQGRDVDGGAQGLSGCLAPPGVPGPEVTGGARRPPSLCGQGSRSISQERKQQKHHQKRENGQSFEEE